MKNLLKQIIDGLRHDFYYLSLFVSLSLPDICASLESNNGKTNGKKYINWFNNYVGAKYKPHFSGLECYYFRCSLLHQGSSQKPESKFSRFIFVEPSKTKKTFHKNIFYNKEKKIKVLNIDIQIFCLDIITGVEKWLREKEGTKNYKKNYKKFMRRYPDGFLPYFKGIAVIT